HLRRGHHLGGVRLSAAAPTGGRRDRAASPELRNQHLMRLARKLTLSMVLGVMVVLSVHAIFTVRSDVAFSEEQIKSVAPRSGTLLVHAMQRSWKNEGDARALQMVDEANEDGSPVRLKWVFLNAPEDDPYAPHLPKPLLQSIALGREVHVRGASA